MDIVTIEIKINNGLVLGSEIQITGQNTNSIRTNIVEPGFKNITELKNNFIDNLIGNVIGNSDLTEAGEFMSFEEALKKYGYKNLISNGNSKR